MGKIVIDEKYCKGCRLCADACPKKLIIEADTLNAKGFYPAKQKEGTNGDCTGCMLCARMCPDVCITVYK